VAGGGWRMADGGRRSVVGDQRSVVSCQAGIAWATFAVSSYRELLTLYLLFRRATIHKLVRRLRYGKSGLGFQLCL
ncbi:MAG: hypothetical protein KJ638_14125, partial [Chloroflexi bacterium]|nr:hypothetical protein [Chloroflexota bacterium]